MINILISNQYSNEISNQLIEETANFTLQHQGMDIATTDLSIVIEDNVKLQELNSQFRGIDAPTDVLSFSSDEDEPDSESSYIGDIIISFEKAKEQAETAGHPAANEVQLLIIHGVLHLLGFDHYTDSEKEEMWHIQEQIIEDLGIKINKLPED